MLFMLSLTGFKQFCFTFCFGKRISLTFINALHCKKGFFTDGLVSSWEFGCSVDQYSNICFHKEAHVWAMSHVAGYFEIYLSIPKCLLDLYLTWAYKKFYDTTRAQSAGSNSILQILLFIIAMIVISRAVESTSNTTRVWDLFFLPTGRINHFYSPP